MKKQIFAFLMLVIFVSSLSFFSGCGDDGQPGSAAISFTWDWYVDSYDDSNPDTPTWIYEYTNYGTSPGTYSYTYYCSDVIGNYWYWYGTYNIYVNPGEEGGWFSDGDNGSDNFFRFGLYGSGPDFYLLKPNPDKPKLKSLEASKLDMTKYESVTVGDPIKETVYSRYGRMEITRQKFELILK